MKIIQTPSPNYSPTKKKKIGAQIHKTLGLMPGTLEWLTSKESQASAHFVIPKVGNPYQLVQLKDRAWTSGRMGGMSKRGKKIMTMYPMGTKPGEILVQFEVECLEHETYNRHQYKLIVFVLKEIGMVIDDSGFNLLTHEDTYAGKPNLEAERTELLRIVKINKSIIRLTIEVLMLKIKLLLRI